MFGRCPVFFPPVLFTPAPPPHFALTCDLASAAPPNSPNPPTHHSKLADGEPTAAPLLCHPSLPFPSPSSPSPSRTSNIQTSAPLLLLLTPSHLIFDSAHAHQTSTSAIGSCCFLFFIASRSSQFTAPASNRAKFQVSALFGGARTCQLLPRSSHNKRHHQQPPFPTSSHRTQFCQPSRTLLLQFRKLSSPVSLLPILAIEDNPSAQWQCTIHTEGWDLPQPPRLLV